MNLFVFERESLTLHEVEAQEATRDRLAISNADLLRLTSKGVLYTPLNATSVVLDPVDDWRIAYGYDKDMLLLIVRQRLTRALEMHEKAVKILRGEVAGFKAVYGS